MADTRSPRPTAVATAPRRDRPIRRASGLLAVLGAAADLAVVTAVEQNRLGIPTVTAAARTPMTASGAALLLLGLAAVGTSFGRKTTTRPTRAVSSRRSDRQVIHTLREHGWYVADDVVLPHVDVDHVAIGPVGVIAVQVQWTNRPDPRGKPAMRARIAAHQLRNALAAREIDIEVVPAVLTFGPGLTQEPGGVRVVDAVAMLNGYQAKEWVEQLSSRAHLPADVVEGAKTVLAELRELAPAPVRRGTPTLVRATDAVAPAEAVLVR